MSERETKKINTLSGKEVIIKTYLTGKENNEVKLVLMEGVTVGADRDISRVPLHNGIAREEKLIELAVVSFDNSSENVLARIQDLPSTEYDALLKQLADELKVNFQKAT